MHITAVLCGVAAVKYIARADMMIDVQSEYYDSNRRCITFLSNFHLHSHSCEEEWHRVGSGEWIRVNKQNLVQYVPLLYISEISFKYHSNISYAIVVLCLN